MKFIGNFIEWPSPHFNDRRGIATPDMLILHYTNMTTPQAALDWWCRPESQVSAHYLVGEDGTVWRVVAEDKRAWHAGKSWWEGDTDINSRSIGIEIANAGHLGGCPPFPAVQMEAVMALCHDIRQRYIIPDAHILGHSDIAPARKEDPGEHFDWRLLAENGLGLWPGPDDLDYEAAAELADETRLRAALTAFGYDPNVDLPIVVTAFHRHFRPEAFPDAGTADPETRARLASLLRIKSFHHKVTKDTKLHKEES